MADQNSNDSVDQSEEGLRIFPADSSKQGAPKNKNLLLKDWKGSIFLLAAVGALLWGAIASFGSGWGLWEFSTGFAGLEYSFYLAAAVAVLIIILMIYDRVKSRKIFWIVRVAALVIALFYVGYILNIVATARSVPAIHDISTDLADPPVFQILSLRADNLDNIPDSDDMQGLSPLQRWTRLHQEAYPTIRSVRIDMRVGDVIAKAERLAKDRGWEIASSVAEQGRLEATETSSIFRFKDDVVLRVRPTENGAGSIIDMRSVSRVGVSDLGANAKRVESFLSDLSGTTTAN